jgi:hypothetical protein
MIHETRVIREGEPVTNFERRGWASGPLIKCPKCDVSYRVFYSPTPAGVPSTIQTQDTVSYVRAVANSHPNHLPDLGGVEHSDVVVASRR